MGTLRPSWSWLAVLVLLGQAAPAFAQFKYLAFGDSITCGKYDGGTCPSSEPIGDPTGGKGYPAQLRARLSCSGASNSCQVYNYGDPGEKTTSGLSRIDDVLDDANGPYDVVLLMEGTNDIGGFGGAVSDQTIRFNLKAMDDKAAARGVDTVFASIIRMDPAGHTHSPSKEARITSLKDDLQNTIAPDRDSWFANPWAVLCPNASCFASDYTGDDGGKRIHPNASGYDNLGDAFWNAILQDNLPVAPSLQSPAGGSHVGNTSVTWTTSVSDPRTTWYQVDWEPGGSQWIQAKEDASCEGGGTCSWAIPNLGPGDHTWRVRGRNPRGRSAWSATRAFTLYTSPPNPTETIAPATDIYDGVEPSEFVWDDVSVATNGPTRYQLNVERDGATVFNQDITNPSCNGNECSHDPGITWTPGNYRWRVRSENPAGASAWSTWREFLFTDIAPDTPTLIYPVDTDTFDTTPLFIWTQEFGAEEYELQIDAESPQTVGNCNGSTCSWAPANPRSVDAHSWKVKAKNPIGASSFSAAKDFTILACNAFPDHLTLNSGSVSGPGLTEEAACHTITLVGPYHVTGTGDLRLHAGDEIAFQDGFRVEPGGELRCRVDP